MNNFPHLKKIWPLLIFITFANIIQVKSQGDDCQRCISERGQLRTDKANLENQNSALNQKINQLNNSLTSLEKENRKLSRELRRCDSLQNSNTEDVSSYEIKIKQLRDSITHLTSGNQKQLDILEKQRRFDSEHFEREAKEKGDSLVALISLLKRIVFNESFNFVSSIRASYNLDKQKVEEVAIILTPNDITLPFKASQLTSMTLELQVAREEDLNGYSIPGVFILFDDFENKEVNRWNFDLKKDGTVNKTPGEPIFYFKDAVSLENFSKLDKPRYRYEIELKKEIVSKGIINFQG